MTIAAPINQTDTRAQKPSVVPQNVRSLARAPTRKATENGINIGCSGWPAIFAELTGLATASLL
jgi:hypothetical protein